MEPWSMAGCSHRKLLSQRQLINRLCEFFHNTWISGCPTSSTSATMGVPRGCGPGLNPPMRFVSRRDTYPFQAFISLTLGPASFIITIFPEVQMRVLVIDPDLVSLIYPGYNCDLRRPDSFREGNAFDPGFCQSRLACFMDNS